ncbi:unnamed protein product [Caretta caretta]
MEEKHRIHPKLTDPGRVLVCKKCLIVLLHLDKLNVDLQGKFGLLSDRVQSVFAFMNKLQLFPRQMVEGELTHFPSMSQLQARSKENAAEPLKRSTTKYASMIKDLKDSFEERFQDLQQKRPHIRFLTDPFSAEADCLNPPLVTEEAKSQVEITELLEDDRLKSVQKTEGTLTFGKSVPKGKTSEVQP